MEIDHTAFLERLVVEIQEGSPGSKALIPGIGPDLMIQVQGFAHLGRRRVGNDLLEG